MFLSKALVQAVLWDDEGRLAVRADGVPMFLQLVCAPALPLPQPLPCPRPP
jgi:hypothetical protein